MRLQFIPALLLLCLGAHAACPPEDDEIQKMTGPLKAKFDAGETLRLLARVSLVSNDLIGD